MHAHRSFFVILFAALFVAGAFAEPLSMSEVNPFDRQIMFPYSEGLDIASDITQYAAFLMPSAFFAASPSSDWLEVGVMYAGSSLLAFGAGTGLKAVIERDRPYMYFDEPPAEAVKDGSCRESFPSRHSIMAFSGAAFTATLFALRYPDSKYRVPVTAAAYTLAGTTAALRIAGGSHFMTDVLAGAAIGSFSGFIVPYVATRFGLVGGEPDGAGFSMTPNSLSYCIKY